MGDDGPHGLSLYPDAAITRLWQPVTRYPKAAIAVSGGPDSVALLCFAQRWCEISGQSPDAYHALTVDHGLRPASASEARFAGHLAASLGFRHTTLPWLGEKPRTGIQAQARMARYGLMTAYALQHDIQAIVTAHHRDDQIETFLLRLKRGSGITGLSAMPVASRFMGVDVVRPLLDEPKAKLQRYLRMTGQPVIDDPSNLDARFERVRLRQMLGQLRQAGIGTDMMALSVKRLRRARAALEQQAECFAQGSVGVHGAGFITIDLAALQNAADEIVIMILSTALAGVGGSGGPVQLAKVEALAGGLASPGPPSRATLGGCLVERKGQTLLIFREKGRMRAPVLALMPGESAIWDGRFRVSTPHIAPGPLAVSPLYLCGLDRPVMNDKSLGIPGKAVETGPAFCFEGRMIAAPQLGYCISNAGMLSEIAASCLAEFINPFGAMAMQAGGRARKPQKLSDA